MRLYIYEIGTKTTCADLAITISLVVFQRRNFLDPVHSLTSLSLTMEMKMKMS